MAARARRSNTTKKENTSSKSASRKKVKTAKSSPSKAGTGLIAARGNSMQILKRHNGFPELDASQLRWYCDESIFEFETTKELSPLHTIVGQHRAIEALRLGAGMNSPGYNIFVSGLSGTGRLTTIEQILQEVAMPCPPTYDYCYVYNFTDPDRPHLLKFPAGRGKEFSKAMDEAITFLKRRIPQLFEEEGFQASRRAIIQGFQEQEKNILHEFDAKIRPSGFMLGQIEDPQGGTQPEVFPIINEKQVSIDDLEDLVINEKLTKQKAEEIREQYLQFRKDLFELAKLGMTLMRDFRKALVEHDKSAVELLSETVLVEIHQRFPGDNIRSYLSEVKNDVLENILLFQQQPPAQVQEKPSDAKDDNTEQNVQEKFVRYSVNIVLDNSGTDCAPVIVETNPTYVNLFGTIERKVDQRGVVKTDFRNIKGGALLKADQGYLIVNALDVLNEQGVWPVLKRVMLYGKLDIQSWDGFYQGSQRHIKPEPIELKVKVIMIGDARLYHWLYFHEEDFKKTFKVNAEFNYETDKTEEMLMSYAHFIAKMCTEENLPHCDRSGVAAIVEWAVRKTDNQNKITLRFSDVGDILRESAYFAHKSSSPLITRTEVMQAVVGRRYRNDLLDEKIRDQIIEGMLLVNTEGSRVGQINGLTVYSTGLVSFGKPVRITASIGVGSAEIINIEREVQLSGSIHNKGVLILAGILRERFAQRRPLTLSASIAFEQSYGDIDGDSASAAETYALLSALSRVPINQNIAVTGSINQKGDIQPVGGVNEKIKGFFEICASRGLTGEQGVIIPIQNIQDLMLAERVIEAVEQGKFHIYPISTLEEGAEILMGIKAGERNEDDSYPADTLFGKVDRRLTELYEASLQYRAGELARGGNGRSKTRAASRSLGKKKQG